MMSNIEKLSSSSSLKDLVDRQELLTNNIEVQKNTLKSILESKNVMVSEEENKLSILIDKVNILESNKLWLYKDGTMFVDFAPFTSGASGYTFEPYSIKDDHIKLEISNKSSTAVVLSTKNKIDLTNFKTMNFELNSSKVDTLSVMSVVIATCENFNDIAKKPVLTSINKTGLNVFSADISNLTGEYYINHWILTMGANTISSSVYKIWLEK